MTLKKKKKLSSLSLKDFNKLKSLIMFWDFHWFPPKIHFMFIWQNEIFPDESDNRYTQPPPPHPGPVRSRFI